MDSQRHAQLDKTLSQLESLMRDELGSHERLLTTLRQKRGAIARADHADVADCLRQENRLVQLIGEQEKHRLALAAQVTVLLEPAAAEPLRLLELAQRVEEPSRGRLLMVRQQLRQRMEEVRQESNVARRAADTLVRHMQGLMTAVSTAMVGPGTYGRRGAAPPPAKALSTFSLTA